MTKPWATCSQSIWRAVLILAMTTALGVLGCSGDPTRASNDRAPVGSADPSATGRDMSSALVPTVNAEYHLSRTIDPVVLEGKETELWARVYRPATLVANQRYPLLVFLHGRYATCGRDSNPRIPEGDGYGLTGACAPRCHRGRSHRSLSCRA